MKKTMKTMKTMKTINSNFNSNFNLNRKNNQFINTYSTNVPLNLYRTEVTPNYISGLTQSDGSFMVRIIKKQSKKSGISYLSFLPVFIITTDADSINVLHIIKNYFGCGTITAIKPDNSVSFTVTHLSDLVNIIIPHFLQYPVFFNKLHSFNLFKEVCTKLYTINNLSSSFIDQEILLKLCLSMNASSTTRSLNSIIEYLNILNLPVPKPFNNIFDLPFIIQDKITTMNAPLTADFVSGMIDGDSSYYIVFNSDGSIFPAFKMCFGSTCLELLQKTQQFVGPGILDSNTNKTILLLIVRNIKTIIEQLIPFSDSIKLHTEKNMHYNIWKKVCLIIDSVKKENRKLDLKTKLEIVELAYNMNKGGKRRKYTKEEYIKLLIDLDNSKK